MINSNKILSCEETNNLDMVDYLSRIGHEPKRISGHQYWYLSPFRNERTASFKINRNINCWYDFGEGKGGTLVDFGIRYFKYSVYEFLQHLFLSPLEHQPNVNQHLKTEDKESPIEIKDVKTISSPALRNYLKERKISFEVADRFCKQIHFSMNEKSYFAIGFQNNSGGYELRNSFFKGSTQPKDVTSIKNDASSLSLFEGFFDFLSYKTIIDKSKYITEDFCILNSLSFLDKAKDFLHAYSSCKIFFDRDKQGVKATTDLIKAASNTADESGLYKSHKDLNEWLTQFGLRSNQSLDSGHKQRLSSL